jgi:hypothetical protein
MNILSVVNLPGFTLTATNLQLQVFRFRIQMKSWQQHYILPPMLGPATSHAGRRRIITSQSYNDLKNEINKNMSV